MAYKVDKVRRLDVLNISVFRASVVERLKLLTLIPMQRLLHPVMSVLLLTGPPSQSPGPHPVPPPQMATWSTTWTTTFSGIVQEMRAVCQSAVAMPVR